jgi:adenosylmethionine-8-amino-7-oxononanoate aminotransferase
MTSSQVPWLELPPIEMTAATTHVFHRHTHSRLPVAVRGEGVYIIDCNRKRYLDASSGAAVSCLGHDHPDVISAIKAQLDAIPYAHTAFFSNAAMEGLADHLAARAPGKLNHVYMVSGGSEAIEAALKLARQYFLETGEPKRRFFVARRQSYHGNTLGALATGGNSWRREPFDPLLMKTHHIAPCYAYRNQQADETEKAYGLRVADELEDKIIELGAENVIGFVAEPVVGATLGAVPPTAGYFQTIREICDRYGILLILDEIMCGMGRTGSFFASEQDGIVGDLVAIAKGLGAGYQPIGALMVDTRIYQAIHDGTGFFQHGHTYLGHATACAAALAVQQVIERDGLIQRAQELGTLLRRMLEDRFCEHPHVGDIRGRGLFLGLEFVEDKANKTPFSWRAGFHQILKRTAMEQGLICYPMGGTIDGRNGSHVLLAPPFILTNDQVGEIVDKLATAIDVAVTSARNV